MGRGKYSKWQNGIGIVKGPETKSKAFISYLLVLGTVCNLLISRDIKPRDSQPVPARLFAICNLQFCYANKPRIKLQIYTPTPTTLFFSFLCTPILSFLVSGFCFLLSAFFSLYIFSPFCSFRILATPFYFFLSLSVNFRLFLSTLLLYAMSVLFGPFRLRARFSRN